MHTESGSAPFVAGDVNEFGLVPKDEDDSENSRDNKDDDGENSPDCPPCPEFCPQQCYPPQQPCGEGYGKLFPKSNEAWQNSQEHNLAHKEEQVARLENQVSELTKLVEKLAIEKSDDAASDLKRDRPTGPRSKPVDPWGPGEKAQTAMAELDVANQQTEQIAALQAKIEELSAAQHSRLAKSSIEAEEREIAEPLIRKSKTSQTERPKTDAVSSPETASTRRSVFGKLGMALSRR